jgi:hypothetical protein
MYLYPLFSVYKMTTTPWSDVRTNHKWWVCMSQAYLGVLWILYWLQKFIFRCFPFNNQQIVLLYSVSFHFTCCFWYQPFCPVYNSSDGLIVGLAFRISIPFRNPQAGVHVTGPLENSWKWGTPQLVHTETSTGSLF